MSFRTYVASYCADHSITLDASQDSCVATISTIIGKWQSRRLQSRVMGWLGIKPSFHGIYLYGSVGRGKSMITQWLYDSLSDYRRQWLHFHEWMQSIHQALHRKGDGEDTGVFIDRLLANRDILFVDELHLTDVADGMLVSRLFQQCQKRGIAVIVSSNRPPHQLYQGGVASDYFVRFASFITTHFSLLSLEGPLDYRSTKIRALTQRYFSPITADTAAIIDALVNDMTQHHPLVPLSLPNQGRQLHFARTYHNLLVSSFAELCLQPYGASDYICIARYFPMIILQDMPALSDETEGVKRFIILIDILYQYKNRIIVTAEVPLESLYLEGRHAFEFARTRSRLQEMQSQAYIEAS